MTAQTREAIGKRIRELRKENHLSQQKLALMVNVERSYLSKLEQGARNPSIDCLEKIAIGLDISLADLFAGIEAPSEEATRPPKPSAIKARNAAPRYDYAVIKLPPE